MGLTQFMGSMESGPNPVNPQANAAIMAQLLLA